MWDQIIRCRYSCLFSSSQPSSSSFRPSGGHPEGEAPGGWRHRLGGGGGQRASGGPGALGKAQECHTQDLLQVRQDHDWVLSGGGWLDQRVRPRCLRWVFFFTLLCKFTALMLDSDCNTDLFFCLCSYIFLEYAAPTQALEAVKNADGYKLDKQHTFRVNLFTDFDKYVYSQDT